MAAITTALLTVLSAGDHLLAQSCLYGGTHDFVTRDLKSFGITYDFIDGNCPENWAAKLKPTTRAIYVETMSNPLLEVPDLEAVVRFAREHNLVSLIDNTFASPVNFRPPEHGFDLSLHSATKYLNGHSDIVAGVVIGRRELVERVKHRLDHFGGSLDPHACFLLHRGVKTLGVRVRFQNRSALEVARFLASHPKVARVNYPGLETHPQHERARRLFDGFGGMLSFELDGGVEAAERFIRNLRLPISAPSLGGVETLITRPATTSHSGMSPEDRRRLGITDSLIRVSIGIEATEDLLADFEQALARV
jgi:cystathionine beta-lyase/cystathionine gamma-synthase